LSIIEEYTLQHCKKWKIKFQTNIRRFRIREKHVMNSLLGSEAVEWGHGDTMVFTGSEENMLVASICDLCER
jgi:hypothetical protein